ncbi:hypothetical protein [Streptomyces sp. TRM49041]|uniref:hypothetical protein n=1 Tax=Streptomyces sp. TRM49041 TaxID=2603216 RepID=UPI0016568CAC|nr:hypothetical protein [Streptomyces sp. TRM49041]
MSLAVLALVGSVQYGFHARALLYSVGDLESWWGRPDLDSREESLRQRQHHSVGYQALDRDVFSIPHELDLHREVLSEHHLDQPMQMELG